MIAILYVLGMEAIGLESFEDIFGEGNLGVAICIEKVSRSN